MNQPETRIGAGAGNRCEAAGNSARQTGRNARRQREADRVIATAAIDRIIAAAPKNLVIAGLGVDDIGARRAAQYVIARRAR